MTRPFFETLRELRNGATLNDLGDAMTELVQQVRITGKGGKLKLTISVKPASKNDASSVLIEDEIEVKKPKIDRSATIFYSTADNSLVRQDPKQRDFVLEPVPRRTDPVAGVATSSTPAFDPTTGEMTSRPNA